MKSTWIFVGFLIAVLIGSSHEQYYRNREYYTTNIYSRQPFQCYVCTNNFDSSNSNSRLRYDQATPSCGFDQDFKPSDPAVRKQLCYTYCMKKEVGIVGSRIDVERRCEPNCQEYNGNTQASYLVDRVSCCVGNYCNRDTKISSNIIALAFMSLTGLGFLRFYY